MNDIRLYFFQTGTIQCKKNNITMNQGENIDYEIPIPFFLLTHPDGHTIIDGGNAVEVATDPETYWGDVTKVYKPVMSKNEGCVEQLKQMGIQPEDVRYVLQSHLHLDHTGAIGRFPNATHIVQRNEYEYAFTPDWFAVGGYISNDFDRPGLKWTFLNGECNDFFDIYGDGTLKTIYTPGHSPGHQSFIINLPNTGSILLAVDAAYTTEHWDERALPGFMTSSLESARSVQKLHYIAGREKSLVVTGHDPDEWKKYRHAPAYYD
ncbi:TPA: N-acyl homoserine lactonase family protein [Serratia marcescens]|nr:N-acyl homoserine lactonase family protein [Serratia marcescens]